MAGTRLFISLMTVLEAIILVGCSLYLTIRFQTRKCIEDGNSGRGRYYAEYCQEHPGVVLWNKASSFLFPEEATARNDNIVLASSTAGSSSIRNGVAHVEFTLWHDVDTIENYDANYFMKKNHRRVSALVEDSFLNPLINDFFLDDLHNAISFSVSSRMGCCLLPEQEHTIEEEPIKIALSSLSKSHFLLDEVNGLEFTSFHDYGDDTVKKSISIVIHVSSQSFMFQQKDSMEIQEYSNIAQYKDIGFLCLANDNAVSIEQAQSSLHSFLQNQLFQDHNPNHDSYRNQEAFEKSFFEDHAFGYYFPLIFPLIVPTFIAFIKEVKRYKQKMKAPSTEKAT